MIGKLIIFILGAITGWFLPTLAENNYVRGKKGGEDGSR